MPNLFLKNWRDTILPLGGGDNRVHNLPKDIRPKVNLITILELELGYFESAVYHYSDYVKGDPT